jgi:uncharacterized membrane protein
MMGFEGVLGILLVLVVLWAVIKFTNRNRSDNSFSVSREDRSGDKENSLNILKKRFARGEISELEYERMKKAV